MSILSRRWWNMAPTSIPKIKMDVRVCIMPQPGDTWIRSTFWSPTVANLIRQTWRAGPQWTMPSQERSRSGCVNALWMLWRNKRRWNADLDWFEVRHWTPSCMKNKMWQNYRRECVWATSPHFLDAHIFLQQRVQQFANETCTCGWSWQASYPLKYWFGE